MGNLVPRRVEMLDHLCAGSGTYNDDRTMNLTLNSLLAQQEKAQVAGALVDLEKETEPDGMLAKLIQWLHGPSP